ncbi:hypothetical protein SFR_5445 [Streptomyces sp. FR-008]|nr:hypothetical protein SFR_5445 [Streptomyces sp. FR-008]
MPSDAERDGLRPGPLEPSAPLSPAPRLGSTPAAPPREQAEPRPESEPAPGRAARSAPASRRPGRPTRLRAAATSGRRARATAQWEETLDRVGRAGEPVPTPRFWRVWWRGLAAVVVMIVAAIVGGTLSGADEAEGVYAQVRLVLADQLRPRDCVLAGSLFDLDPRERAAAEKVSVTSCWGPHDGVVFGRLPLAGTAAETSEGGFAGPAKVREVARLGCAERFAEEAQDPYSHDFTIQALYPVTGTEWGKGRRTVVCWASAKGLFQEGEDGMSLFDHHNLDEQQEAFHQALKPLTRARAERPDEEESLRTERRWATSMKRAVEETVHRLRFDDGMGHFGTAAAADLADVLATQVPAWDAAAKAKDADAYSDAWGEAELEHSFGTEMAEARQVLLLPPVITE